MANDIRITVEHNEYRLNGTLQFLDAGTGPAKVLIYGNTKPVNIEDAAGASPLVSIELEEPSGSIVAGVLVLAPGDDALIANSGEAIWARVINGNGATVMDCDVSEPLGTATIKIPDTTLFAGGVTRLISGTLG